MSEENRRSNKEENMEATENTLDPRVKDPGFWREIWEQIRLVWLLLRDDEVPIYLKVIPVLAFIYLIFPLDLISDPILGLGQLDDLTAIILGTKMFIEMSPQHIVNRHIRAMRRGYSNVNLEDLDEVEPSEKEIDASIIIEGDYEMED